ncbi:hypothetical protein N7509_004040 [Penicillium cosmopolitanum]|uniref:Nineteen complex-related protein 2-domain-containing protein n=1 Tax=Penicillium cosmopolitanum TaxID=1131564 RepID=A0A9W9W633_9EURO|nr:uncharacterized protein N7509_004040 [Penicillium cosmopolitanum]KAJ5404169.1 hypothetical protein N7509_004040 [Penicillium cosmopolitanum]
MSSKFANRRKPRKIGGDEEDEGEGNGVGAAPEPVVKRPIRPKAKQKSKLNLSFGETSMADDDDQDSGVVIPKRHGLGRKAMERSAVQRTLDSSAAPRVSQDSDRPSYSNDYLKELRDSTPSTPKASTDDEKDRTVDVAAKFGEVMKVSGQSAIPSEAEIREKKARRQRLALEHGANLKEEDYIALDDNATRDDDDWDAVVRGDKEEHTDTRLIRDDEDFAEGFDEYVEDGKISLGKKAEREQKRKDRDAMRELINDAEGISDSEDSDIEEKAAYEATQTKAAIGSRSDGIDRPRTPPKMTSLPKLSHSLERLRLSLATMETSKTQMISRMEDLRKEKADIAVREVEIQKLIKEAGDNYERLKKEAGVEGDADGAAAGALEQSRGLESIGAPITTSATEESNDEDVPMV